MLDEAVPRSAQFATFSRHRTCRALRTHPQEARMTTIATLDARRLSAATAGSPFRR
ncbi:MAG: hypothetical protein ACK57B_11105 [Betaproteobacteria bacterium]